MFEINSNYPNPHSQGCPWFDLAERFGAPNLKWCENTLCSLVSEPSNTWSNLVYFIFAYLIYLSAKKAQKKRHYWFAISMFLMGAFSFFYHMSNFYYSQLLDFVGMYLFLFWVFAVNLQYFKKISTPNTVFIYIFLVISATLSTHFAYLAYIQYQYFVVIVGAMIIGVEIGIYFKDKLKFNLQNYKFLIASLTFILIAQSFSFADLHRVFCIPNNHILTGHATWHLFSSLGLYLGYKHWEQRPLPPN